MKPFSSSLNYVSWMERNCFTCKKYDPEQVHPETCPIDEALTLYAVGGEPVPDELAKRAGLPGAKCAEYEPIKPNLSINDGNKLDKVDI